MFTRDMVERPKRHAASTASSAFRDSFAPGDTPEQDTRSAPARPTNAAFDIGRIAIMPPQAQVGPEGGALSPDLSGRVMEQRGRGAPLEPAVQRQMETSFGHPFADVRLHTDRAADELNQHVGARAFTLGSDIFLSRDATDTSASGGNELLAHELTHVVQQRGARGGGALTVG